MEKIQFDNGIRQFRLGSGGVLRFNPGDPNVYARFLEGIEKIGKMEQQLLLGAKDGDGQDSGARLVKLLQDADKSMKGILSWIFGQDNDFDKILEGVNLLAVGNNGKRVVSNLFDALQPILLAGAESCAQEKAQAAVKKARARRESQ